MLCSVLSCDVFHLPILQAYQRRKFAATALINLQEYKFCIICCSIVLYRALLCVVVFCAPTPVGISAQ
nr:MAG TPA: hypothetical protein [Caudoviricetes sp.]